ncbi:DUF1697 domain-containing protein [Labedella phragmitis]|uniref:DUF1697 domain-containing protein n=1 Tax=Labedella phragmitis TaxID=2498849 RepID=UPI001AA08F31|nr:DUF1697 domain-containing protein [Labedella phragmitis]
MPGADRSSGDPLDLSIALLRGVNVGGITVRSAPLAAAFESLGYSSVRTVLASGNVVFDGGDRRPDVVKRDVERALEDAFGYDAWIVLTTQSRVRAIAEAFPFAEVDGRQPYVVFGSDEAILDDLASFAETETDPAVERIVRGDGVLYWDLPRGSSTDTAFAKRSARSRYRSSTTTRNLRTLRKLV